MTNIVIQGINGRMGHVLQELIEKRTDCKIVGGVDLNAADGGAFPVVSDFGALAVDADVLIDFSAPAATRRATDPLATRYKYLTARNTALVWRAVRHGGLGPNLSLACIACLDRAVVAAGHVARAARGTCVASPSPGSEAAWRVFTSLI